jgi:hypothetical protein
VMEFATSTSSCADAGTLAAGRTTPEDAEFNQQDRDFSSVCVLHGQTPLLERSLLHATV